MTKVTIAKLGFPGLIRDLAGHDLSMEAFTEVRNARFGPYGARAFGGNALALDTAVVPPYWLKPFPPLGSPLWVYAGLEKVYAYDGSTHNDITRVAGDYTAAIQERWQGEVFNGLGIFNNTFDVPQLWTEFDGSTPLVDLTNWPATLRCKALRPHGFFLIALHTIESGNPRPYRIRWSHPAAPGTVPASWALNDPTKDSGEFDEAETSDYIVDGLSLGQLFIVYKQKTAYAMQFVGRPNIFAKWPILPSHGLLTRDCVTAFSKGHFAVSTDDIYVHTGQRESAQSLVEATLRDWIFRQLDTNSFFNCYVVNYERRGEIWFCFPEAGETYPNIALVWNSLTGGVGIRDLHGSPFIYPGPIDLAVSPTWDGSGAGLSAAVALEASKSVLAGVGNVDQHLSGSSALAALKVTIVGFGSVNDAGLNYTGSGALVASNSLVAGIGVRVLEGTGALIGKVPLISSAGIRGVEGAGTPTTVKSAVAGTGTRHITGTGVLTAASETMSGSGTVTEAPGAELPAAMDASRVRVTPTTATASINLGNGGGWTLAGDSTAPAANGTWLLTGVASDYECRMTVNSGSFTTGTLNTWLGLGTTRTWACITPGTPAVVEVDATLEIRKASTGIVQATANVTLYAEEVSDE